MRIDTSWIPSLVCGNAGSVLEGQGFQGCRNKSEWFSRNGVPFNYFYYSGKSSHGMSVNRLLDMCARLDCTPNDLLAGWEEHWAW